VLPDFKFQLGQTHLGLTNSVTKKFWLNKFDQKSRVPEKCGLQTHAAGKMHTSEVHNIDEDWWVK